MAAHGAPGHSQIVVVEGCNSGSLLGVADFDSVLVEAELVPVAARSRSATRSNPMTNNQKKEPSSETRECIPCNVNENRVNSHIQSRCRSTAGTELHDQKAKTRPRRPIGERRGRTKTEGARERGRRGGYAPGARDNQEWPAPLETAAANFAGGKIAAEPITTLPILDCDFCGQVALMRGGRYAALARARR